MLNDVLTRSRLLQQRLFQAQHPLVPLPAPPSPKPLPVSVERERRQRKALLNHPRALALTRLAALLPLPPLQRHQAIHPTSHLLIASVQKSPLPSPYSSALSFSPWQLDTSSRDIEIADSSAPLALRNLVAWKRAASPDLSPRMNSKRPRQARLPYRLSQSRDQPQQHREQRQQARTSTIRPS